MSIINKFRLWILNVRLKNADDAVQYYKDFMDREKEERRELQRKIIAFRKKHTRKRAIK